MQQQTKPIEIIKAGKGQIDDAYRIVDEYSQAINVYVRDTREDFGKYFEEGAGIWLALDGSEVVGCIAVRPLPQFAHACEVKRLYVKPAFRGRKIADQLLRALHQYAAACGYQWCYLDSKSELQTAIRFYFQQGYEECPRYNDNPEATIFLRYRLP